MSISITVEGWLPVDFNGDGLGDIYFTSNMGNNKFYLNKGNMRFEDITQWPPAGGRQGPWKTGVTFTDVNGDSRLDIYVCYSGAVSDENRVNQLFINQGNNEKGHSALCRKGKRIWIWQARCLQ